MTICTIPHYNASICDMGYWATRVNFKIVADQYCPSIMPVLHLFKIFLSEISVLVNVGFILGVFIILQQRFYI